MPACCNDRARYLDALVVIHKYATGTDDRVEDYAAVMRAVRELVAERDGLRRLVLAEAERIAAQSEKLTRKAERPTTAAFLNAFSDADLNRLRLDTIPRLLR